MFSTSIPPKFPIPWGNSAAAGTIRPIPTASQIGTQPGAASLTDGFPPLNGIPVSAGGIPPFQQDTNGILNRITAWDRWHQAGGPVGYDIAFATAAGGYPARALVQSDSGHAWYENLVDNNFTNPNLGGANWRLASSVWSAFYWAGTGSANAQSITLVPAATSLAMLSGIPFTFISVGSSTTSVTLNVNGLGAFPIVTSNITLLSSGALTTGGAYQVVFDGVEFHLLSPVPVFTDPGQVGLTVAGSGAFGANLQLSGTGATATPNKFLRSLAGAFQIVNSAYTAVLATITDAGALNTAGAIAANTGNITSSTGRLRAALGSFGSGDGNSGVILGDFLETGNNTGWVRREPDGLLIMGAKITITGNNLPITVTLPTAFHSQFLGVTASYAVNLQLGVPIGAVGAEAGADLASIIMCSNTNPVQNNGVYYVAWGV